MDLDLHPDPLHQVCEDVALNLDVWKREEHERKITDFTKVDRRYSITRIFITMKSRIRICIKMFRSATLLESLLFNVFVSTHFPFLSTLLHLPSICAF